MQDAVLTIEHDSKLMSELNAFVLPSLFVVESFMIKFFNLIAPISSLASHNVRGLFRVFVNIQKNSIWLSTFIIASYVCR